MPRENSFSDSDGRSLTPDLEDEVDMIGPSSPIEEPVRRVEDTGVLPGTTRSASPPPLAAPVATNPFASSQAVQIISSIPSSDDAPAGPPRNVRFRAAARKIISMHRTSTAITSTIAGAEPGVDPRRASAMMHYSHLQMRCTIDIVDYSSTNMMAGRMDNRQFVQYLRDARASQRDHWVKVRWINIGGISWDVMSALAIKYDIHPLALEDILHQRSNARSKADYYMKHLFLRILRHSFVPEDEDDSHTFGILPRSTSPDSLRDSLEEDDPVAAKAALRNGDVEKTGAPARRGRSTARKSIGQAKEEQITIDELKKGERVNVDRTPMYILLYRDGTVISISPKADLEYTMPITNRVRQHDTGLRTSADAALLVQSLLDLVVDQVLEIVDEYQKRILKLEHICLVKPKMKTVRHLHILSGDLTLHRRTLEPIKTLVYGLRRYDVDRCAALVSDQPGQMGQVQGFMSHKSKIYLADVYDHMEYILSSLDMYASITENLINYTFNMKSYEMNEVMRILTMATIIFLPLSLLTGYFGMNFYSMFSVSKHTDVFFWEVAIPVMAAVIPLFMWQDIVRMVHYVQKKWLTKRAVSAYKKQQ